MTHIPLYTKGVLAPATVGCCRSWKGLSGLSEYVLDIYCTYVWILVQLRIVSGSIRVISEITARGSLMAGWMSDDSLMVRSPIEIVPNQKQFGTPLSMDF